MRTNQVFLLLLTLSFFVGCNSNNFEEHQIGDNLIDESSEVVLIDSLTIKSSTVILDSVITSRFSNAILGRYQDEFLGDVKSEYYGVLDFKGGFPKPVKKVDNVSVKVPIRFDSLVFMAYPNKEYFGDTLKVQRLIINRLTENIKLPDNENFFYAHSKFDYNETPLLDTEFFLNPVKQSDFDDVIDSHGKNQEIDYYGEYYGKGIYIKMDDEEAISLGEEIVELVNAESDTVVEPKHWHKYIKGLVIRSGDNNSVMWKVPIGDNKVRLRLYYSETDYEEAGRQKFHDFPIVLAGTDESWTFTNYLSDRSSTPQQLDKLEEQKNDLESDETDNLTFIQGGVGLYTKINIPYIENLKTLGITGGVLRAELRMYPKNNSFDDELFPLPPAIDGQTNLLLYNTNEDNEFKSTLPGSNNTPLSFVLMKNYQNKNETYYTADLTSYVNNILVNGKEYEDAILIGFPLESVGNTYDRLIIEDDPSSDFRIRLKVTYVIQR
ncbi:DUF4270 family protein [Marinifilum flexuosum]|nr:DUF4270 family protein [Marinifilum flexuosum]